MQVAKLKFSLRAMAIVTGVIAVALMPLVYAVRRAQKEHEFIVRVQEIGGTVWFAKPAGSTGLGSGGGDFWPKLQVWTSKVLGYGNGNLWQRADLVSFVEYQGDSAQLELLTELTSVRELAFVHAHVDSKLIDVVMRMPSLQRLNLSDTDVDDQALERLVTNPHLRYVNIMGSRATPEAVQAFCDARPDCKLSVAPDTEFMTWLNRLFEEQASAAQSAIPSTAHPADRSSDTSSLSSSPSAE